MAPMPFTFTQISITVYRYLSTKSLVVSEPRNITSFRKFFSFSITIMNGMFSLQCPSCQLIRSNTLHTMFEMSLPFFFQILHQQCNISRLGPSKVTTVVLCSSIYSMFFMYHDVEHMETVWRSSSILEKSALNIESMQWYLDSQSVV